MHIVDIFAAIKPLENVWQVGGRNADSVIKHTQMIPFLILPDLQDDFAAFGRVFHRIVEDIIQHLHDSPAVKLANDRFSRVNRVRMAG